jgi:hypothetical protein
MNDISINPYLAIPTIICLITLTVFLIKGQKIKERRGTPFYFSFITFLTIYLVIVGGALYLDIYYQWDLNKYDLDKDGFFGSPNETTHEQQFAMGKLTNDLGRNLSFIVGLPFSGVFSVLTYFTIKVYNRLKADGEIE